MQIVEGFRLTQGNKNAMGASLKEGAKGRANKGKKEAAAEGGCALGDEGPVPVTGPIQRAAQTLESQRLCGKRPTGKGGRAGYGLTDGGMRRRRKRLRYAKAWPRLPHLEVVHTAHTP